MKAKQDWRRASASCKGGDQRRGMGTRRRRGQSAQSPSHGDGFDKEPRALRPANSPASFPSPCHRRGYVLGRLFPVQGCRRGHGLPHPVRHDRRRRGLPAEREASVSSALVLVEPTSARNSPRWRAVHQIELREMCRGKDEVLRKKLVALRTSMPTKKLLQHIARGCKAWSGHHEPIAWDLQQLYRSVPHTTVATCALVNDLSVWVLFATGRRRQLGELDVEWESNAAHFDSDHKLITGRPPVPFRMKVTKECGCA